jgi:hypothetical protein
MDVNRQAWTAQASLLVHAADRYVGCAASGRSCRRERRSWSTPVATDLDGRSAVGSAIRSSPNGSSGSS